MPVTEKIDPPPSVCPEEGDAIFVRTEKEETAMKGEKTSAMQWIPPNERRVLYRPTLAIGLARATKAVLILTSQ